MEASGKLDIQLDGKRITILRADVEIVSESAEGLMIQQEGNLVVALDVTISPELKMEGLAREFVNRVQNMRKNAGFDVVDRINIYAELPDIIQQAVKVQSDYICNEKLANVLSDKFEKTGFVQEWKIDGQRATIAIERI